MKKNLIILIILFLTSCENEIVQEMKLFNGKWEINDTNLLILSNSDNIKIIDFGNGVTSKKQAKRDSVLKTAFVYDKNNLKVFSFGYKVISKSILKIENFVDNFEIIPNSFSLLKETELAKKINIELKGQWNYTFENEKITLTQESKIIVFQKKL